MTHAPNTREQHIHMARVYGSFFGPFWSRESATKYLDGRRHRFADNAIVYCGSCNDSPELKKLFDLSKAIGGKQ